MKVLVSTILLIFSIIASAEYERPENSFDTIRKDKVNFILEGKVEKISDGDTIKLKGKDNTTLFKIRFSDIDTPEVFHKSFVPRDCKCKTVPDRLGQPGGIEATKKLNSIIKIGDDIRAECYEVGRYGRFICHVFKGNIDVNLEMVKSGWGWPSINKKHVRNPLTYEMEKMAKKSRKGAWGLTNQVHPDQWRKQCWQPKTPEERDCSKGWRD